MHSRAKLHPPLNETNLGLFSYFTPSPFGGEGGRIHWWIGKGKKNQAFYVISVSVFGIIEE